MIEYQVQVYPNRTEWRLNGKLHREDGPAIEHSSGWKVWYLNGIQLTEEQFLARTQTKELTVAEIEQLLGHPVKIVNGSLASNKR